MLDIFERLEVNPDIVYFVIGKQAKELIETLPDYKVVGNSNIVGHYKGIPVIYLENMKEDEVFAFYKGKEGMNDPIYIDGECKWT